MSHALKILVGALLVFGIIILGLGESETDPDNLVITFSEFDQIVQTPVEKIDAIELAEYLIAQKEHYNLIDLQAATASYQIPTSDVYNIQSFLDKAVPVNETIILYAESESKAIQLYYLLLTRGYFKVKVLAGGMMAWKQSILQPSRSSIPKESIKRREEITNFFGGVIQDSSDKSSKKIEGFPKTVILKKKNKKHKGC